MYKTSYSWTIGIIYLLLKKFSNKFDFDSICKRVQESIRGDMKFP